MALRGVCSGVVGLAAPWRLVRLLIWRFPERIVLQPIIFEHITVLWNKIIRTIIGFAQSMGDLVTRNPVSPLLRVPEESMSGTEL